MFYPDNLVIQWHLTDKCNLRCTHCYQDSYKAADPGITEWISVVMQIVQFMRDGDVGVVFRFTGGEPFSHKDFIPLLQYISSMKVPYSILSNATMLTDEAIEVLSLGYCDSFQVSIDGTKEVHDKIRGAGNFDKAVEGIARIRSTCPEISIPISFTANQDNFRDFENVAKVARDIGASSIWSDRMNPMGVGAGMVSGVLTREETKEYVELIHKAKHLETDTFKINAMRALQFKSDSDRLHAPYVCTAGDKIVTIMPDGGFSPCRRLPHIVGNVFESGFSKLYFSREMQDIRDEANAIPEGCKGCKHQETCRGGLKCLSLSVNGSMVTTDPGCWTAPEAKTKKTFILKIVD